MDERRVSAYVVSRCRRDSRVLPWDYLPEAILIDFHGAFTFHTQIRASLSRGESTCPKDSLPVGYKQLCMLMCHFDID